MLRNLPPSSNRRRRRGFTLVELLVVIAIIAILAALAAYGVFAMIGGQQSRNTQSTIKVVNKFLHAHWRHVQEEADKDTPSRAVMMMSGGDTKRAKVLWRKFRLMEAFPQTFAEIGGPATVANVTPFVYSFDSYGNQYIPSGQQRYLDDYQKKFVNNPNLNLGNTNPLAESSACLRIALSVSRTGVTFNDDLIKFAVVDTDGDGIPELVDGWGRTMAFFRFADNSTNNVGFVASNPALGKAARTAQYPDPTDPDGMLVTPVWYQMPPVPPAAVSFRVLFENQFHPVTNPYPWPAGKAPPYTGTYVAPVIVSAGRDGKFGFAIDGTGHYQANMSIATASQDSDNIYSFQLPGN